MERRRLGRRGSPAAAPLQSARGGVSLVAGAQVFFLRVGKSGRGLVDDVRPTGRIDRTGS
jgi:hypothetical protein